MLGSAARRILLQAQLPEPSQSPDEVRRLADEVLSRPQFRRAEPSAFDRAQEWIADQLGRVFEGLAGGGRGTVVGFVLLAAAIAGVVVLATRAARTVSFEPRGRQVDRSEPPPTAAEWLQRAERAEAGGDWPEGLRCRHRALVARLAERGVVEDVPGRTAGEYRGEVRQALPMAATEFADATDLFERAWYGAAEAGPDERARFGALADEIVERAAR